MSGASVEGYSVSRRDGEVYVVFRGDREVARLSRLGPAFGDRLAFDWHDRKMWVFSSSDFVVDTRRRQPT